jgi:hypothetical protein
MFADKTWHAATKKLHKKDGFSKSAFIRFYPRSNSFFQLVAVTEADAVNVVRGACAGVRRGASLALVGQVKVPSFRQFLVETGRKDMPFDGEPALVEVAPWPGPPIMAPMGIPEPGPVDIPPLPLARSETKPTTLSSYAPRTERS